MSKSGAGGRFPIMSRSVLAVAGATYELVVRPSHYDNLSATDKSCVLTVLCRKAAPMVKCHSTASAPHQKQLLIDPVATTMEEQLDITSNDPTKVKLDVRLVCELMVEAKASEARHPRVRTKWPTQVARIRYA